MTSQAKQMAEKAQAQLKARRAKGEDWQYVKIKPSKDFIYIMEPRRKIGKDSFFFAPTQEDAEAMLKYAESAPNPSMARRIRIYMALDDLREGLRRNLALEGPRLRAATQRTVNRLMKMERPELVFTLAMLTTNQEAVKAWATALGLKAGRTKPNKAGKKAP